MLKTDEYIFWAVPDLPENPKKYLIYRLTDQKQAIAVLQFEDNDYDVFEVPGNEPLTNLEQLKILEACDLFLQKMYFYNWD
jgi:hypothetical protein